MMAGYSIYHNQWLFVTLFGGIGLVLAFILCYWALWRPRREEKEAQEEEIKDLRSFTAWLLRVAPWAVILAVLGTATYTVIHTALAALRRPNW